MACLGPIIGIKKDELYDDDDDMEDAKYPGSDEMRKAKKKKRPPSTPAAGTVGDKHGSVGATRWVKYTDPISVEGGKNQVKQTLNRVTLKGFRGEEFHTVCQVQKLHTLEIIDCCLQELPPGLKELEFLAVLRVSRNHLTKFAEELKDCKNIMRIIFDHNRIEDFPPGIFNARSFKKLEVINLSFNPGLSILPQDFGSCAKPDDSPLCYIDLSHCALRALPDNLFQSCVNLQTLNVSHNFLRKLPPIPHDESGKKFVKIEKLFVSFNELDELPEKIGTCKNLQKIRLVKNNVQKLPESILNLWQKGPQRAGRLDELLVERNPLIMPSITAFEMGTDELSRIDKAFMLFQSQLEEERLQKQSLALVEEEKKKLLERQVSQGHGDEKAPGGEDREDAAAAEDRKKPDPYYFGHLTSDEAVTKIRQLESTLLLLKKESYVQNKIEQLKEMQRNNQEVPANLKKLTEEGYNPDKYAEKIPVSDLDLYFNLMVYSTKHLFSRCDLLFDQYSAGENDFMVHEEWVELCSSVAIIIPDHVRTTMWRLMAWRHPHDKIMLNDFVAAWHIHDVDEGARDPWIKRITSVLNLDYYDMSVHELQCRLNARDGQDATPQLDFDHIAAKPTSGDLEANEGIHRIRQSPLEASPEDGVARAKKRQEDAEANQLRSKVGLSDAQHVKYNKLVQQDGEEPSDGEESLLSFRSSNLSEDTEAEFGDFDAEMFLQQHEVRRKMMSAGNGGKQSIKDMNDDDIKALMEISPEALLEKRNQRQNNDTLLGLEPISKAHRMPRVKKDHYVDPDLFTDVHKVRQGIRAVYRNLPFGDFVKLINFLLRGMQLIKHSPKESLTYWHADDPTFKHTMGSDGTNPYTRALLKQMGFVLLADVYWVWPSVHLELNDGVPTWARKEVPTNCPGRQQHRLEDMIILFRSCQRALHREGREKFRGHFQTEYKF